MGHFCVPWVETTIPSEVRLMTNIAQGSLNDSFVTNVIAAHGMWKYRLHAAIERGQSDFSPQTVARDDQCALGKWLYGDARSHLAGSADYERIKELHAAFHRGAAAILERAL